MKAEEKVILYDSEAAATFKEGISGWVSSSGRFWGKDEHMARYDGSTHRKCPSCENLIEKSRSICAECWEIKQREQELQMPYKIWDGSEPVYSSQHDKYFFDAGDIEDYFMDLEDPDLAGSEVSLIICEPNYFNEVDAGYWSDILPQDSDGDLPKELEEKLKELNDVIAKLKPASWSPGKFRTSYKLPFE